jgi:hypothetical protein
VRERLQVLYPGDRNNVYDEFSLCPSDALRQRLNQAELLVENWHSLMPHKPPIRSVVKKGLESDEAFTRRVLGKLAGFKDLVVINDEAHHAYRKPADVKISKKEAAERGIDLDEATRWIEGLDRIHKTRRIQRCFDLSATPFAPTGKTSSEEGLFGWIVSDFGLNDAIEAGLVKTPRVVVRDGVVPDSKTLKPKLYHLYRDPAVKEDLNRKRRAPQALPQPGATSLHPARCGLARDPAAVGGRRPSIAAGNADGLQPHRDRRRVEHYLNQRRCPVAGAARDRPPAAGRLESAGEGRSRRSEQRRQGLRGAPARDR